MIKGQLVDVYQDPITRLKLEERNARVVRVLRAAGWKDDAGHQIFRCKVCFAGDSGTYERDVSDI